MIALALFIPVALLGAIVWAVAALLRRQAGEPFTLATAIAAYAHLMIFVGAIMALVGLATMVKSALGYADLSYSYRTYTYLPPPTIAGSVPPGPSPLQQNRHDRDTDLVQGIVLAVVGAIVVGAHLLIARGVRRLHGGAPAWIGRGTLVLLALLSALTGFIAGSIGIYRWLSYAVVAPAAGQSREPFGEPAGYAVAFLPLWLLTMIWLLRALRDHTA